MAGESKVRHEIRNADFRNAGQAEILSEGRGCGNAGSGLLTSLTSKRRASMNILLRLSLVCTVAFCLVGLTAPSSAKADGPYVEAFDFVIDHEPVANCGDFTIIADGGG